MANSVRDIGLAGLKWSRNMTLGLLEDVPDDQLCVQPFPGANHALWVLGHLAWTDHYFVKELGKRASTCEWDALFGMGSQPIADRAKYPSRGDLLGFAASRRGALLEWFGSMSESQLFTPLPKDWETFAPHYAGLMTATAWHEGLHAGQLTVVRKHLGLKPKFG